MVRRGARLVLRGLAGLVAGLALFMAFAVWRLSSGPVSLDFLAPHIANAIAAALPGVVAEIEHSTARLEPGGTIEIDAEGVHLRRREGGAQLTLPDLSFGLSVREALTGVIAPTRIILGRPELRIERAPDGAFHLGLGSETPAAGDAAESLLRELAAPPDRKGPLGHLVQVAVRNAVLTVDDRALDVTWRAKRVDAAMFRSESGFFGDMALTAEDPSGGETELRSDFRYTPGEDRFSMQVGFTDLRPALFAGAALALAPLAALDLPASGQVRVALDVGALRIIDAWCDLALGGGRLVHPALAGGALAVASGQARAIYDPGQGRVTVQLLRVDAGGPRLEASGTVDGLGGDLLAGSLPTAINVAASLQLSEVPVDKLPDFWPERLAPKARSWIVDHIHGGVAGAKGEFAVHVDWAADAPRPVRLDNLSGTLDYRGLTVEYFRPLPPLEGVAGAASFDRASLDLIPTAGAVKGVQLTGGTAKLSKLDSNDEEIAIDLSLRGPVRDVLEVLDSEPLRYAREVKLDPSRVAGDVDGHVLFDFPLKHDLALAQVDFGARAALAGVSIAQVLAGRDLTAGNFQLQLDRTSLRLDGTAEIADVPATLSWVQSLKPGEEVRARYRLKARLDDEARRRLGVDFMPDVMKGAVGADVAYALMADKHATVSLSLDLQETELDVAKLNWAKPTGVPATATAELDLVDDRVGAIRDATLKGGGADVRASVTFTGGGEVSRAELPRLIAGETDASATLASREEGGWRVEVNGLSFDATGLMSGLDRTAANQASAPMVIDARLDRLILGPKREARDVKGQLYSDGVHWQSASIDATLFGSGKASLRFGEAGGGRSFHLSSTDFGGVLRLLDISDNVAGGQLEITGNATDRGPLRLFRGEVNGTDYRVVKAPLFARLLSVASFSGFAALLSGEGIPFTRLSAEFAVADGKIEIRNGRAYGGAIGINASGAFDTNANTLDFAGTLVPAYTLNSVLGNIPVLGKILLGGEGQGLFAANFKIAGPVSDPKITVNPLSALAPGALRKLFLFAAPEPDAAPAPPTPGGDQPQ
jgi:hypothetical protein